MNTAKNTETNQSIVKFKGIDSIESNISLYNDKLKENEYLVQNACEAEIKELQKAQEKFRNKLQNTLKSKEVKKLQEEILDAEEKVSFSFNRLQREYNRMQDDIQESDSSNKTKQKQLTALNKAVAEQYHIMAEKYPAAMKAQMLLRISSSNLLF